MTHAYSGPNRVPLRPEHMRPFFGASPVPRRRRGACEGYSETIPSPVKALLRRVALDNYVTVGEMLSSSKTREITWARWEAFAELRLLQPRPSLSRIAAWFGMDHTTVRNGLLRRKERKAREDACD